jgi:hypothetical protein
MWSFCIPTARIQGLKQTAGETTQIEMARKLWLSFLHPVENDPEFFSYLFILQNKPIQRDKDNRRER